MEIEDWIEIKSKSVNFTYIVRNLRTKLPSNSTSATSFDDKSITFKVRALQVTEPTATTNTATSRSAKL